MHTNWIFAVLLLPLIIGCASAEPSLRAVLLPDRQGQAGSVIVKTAQGGEVTLDQSYMAADVYTDKKIETKMIDPETVQKQFGQALSAQPQRPISYTLYFITEKDELTPESKLTMEQMKTELTRRAFPEITVIGHTDSAGTAAYNDALSLKRAEAMRQIMEEAGIPSKLIKSASRGSREMLVKTEDGVSEPRNRRVEISIR
jgi:outer membrane protein OmpA-like peptidoglycan-associated protein